MIHPPTSHPPCHTRSLSCPTRDRHPRDRRRAATAGRGCGCPAHDTPIRETATATVSVPEPPSGYGRSSRTDEQEWDEPIDELPPRPRRRLLGAGGNPVVLVLLGVLLIACGFIGGVLVEKGQTLLELLRWRRRRRRPRLALRALRERRRGHRHELDLRRRIAGLEHRASSARPPAPWHTSPGARCT